MEAAAAVPLKGCECSTSEQSSMTPPPVRRQESSSPWRGQPERQANNPIDFLANLLGYPLFPSNILQESDQPFKDVLENEDVADAIVSRITEPHSGKGSDQLCQWLYESYQAGDPALQAVVLRFIPTLCGVYYSRTCGDIDEPLAGFEAVLLALHTEEAKARGGRPVLIHLPSLSQPSLYHTPALASSTSAGQGNHQYAERLLSAPLEPQTAIKSTKRAAIVGLALELFWRQIAVMPPKSKLEFCRHARRWAVSGCSWGSQIDEIAKLAILPVQPVGPPVNLESVPHLGHALATGEPLAVSKHVFEQPPHQRTVEASKAALVERTLSDTVTSSIGSQSFNSATSNDEYLGDAVGDEDVAVKLPLSLDLLRPIFKVLGHCLVANTNKVDIKEAALGAARALYVRASEDLLPEAILASRSLVRLGVSLMASPQTSMVDESPRASTTSPTAVPARMKSPNRHPHPQAHPSTLPTASASAGITSPNNRHVRGHS